MLRIRPSSPRLKAADGKEVDVFELDCDDAMNAFTLKAHHLEEIVDEPPVLDRPKPITEIFNFTVSWPHGSPAFLSETPGLNIETFGSGLIRMGTNDSNNMPICGWWEPTDRYPLSFGIARKLCLPKWGLPETSGGSGRS